MIEQHSFIIPIASLQHKVEMHTTVLGKHRSAENMPHLMEQYSLTEGERFLFDEYLKEAAVKTYFWIKAFGRNLTNAMSINRNVTPIQVREQNGVTISVNNIVYDFPVKISPTVAQYTQTPTASGCDVVIDFGEIRIGLGDASQVRYEICVRYTTIADNIFEDHGEWTDSNTITADAVISTITVPVTLSQEDFPTALKSIDEVVIRLKDVEERTSQTYTKGSLIEFIRKDGKHVFGFQDKTSNKIEVSQWFDENMNESIVFRVELPDWQDRNMLPSAQEHLEDAMLHYIMYRWFETVAPKEAEAHYNKWEEKGREAQMALNSERRILQRKSTWL